MNRSEAEFEVDGVKRRVPNGIKVIVAGGGVGGAFAALEHWRNGCDVVLLERSDMVSALGERSCKSIHTQFLKSGHHRGLLYHWTVCAGNFERIPEHVSRLPQ